MCETKMCFQLLMKIWDSVYICQAKMPKRGHQVGSEKKKQERNRIP